MIEIRARAQQASAAHHALAILGSTTRDEVVLATARALRATLGGAHAYVALRPSRREDGDALTVVAIDGESPHVAPRGTALRAGAETAAVGAKAASWVGGARHVVGVRALETDAVVVPIGEKGVAVVLVKGLVDPKDLEAATLLGSSANVALQHVRAAEEGRTLTRRLEALLELQRTLASSVLEDSFAAFAQRLGAEVPFELAIVAALGGAGRDVEVVAAHGEGVEPPAVGASLSAVHGPLAAVLRSARARSAGPTFVSTDEAAMLAPWARSGAIVPLAVHDALLGVFVVLSRKPHLAQTTLPADVPWLLSAVAEPLAMALQNAALVGRLRSAMRDWQTTFDVMDSMVLVADEGVVRRANWPLARRVGATPSALVGRAVGSLFPGQSLPTAASPRTTLVGPQGEPLRASGVTLPEGGMVIVLHDVRAASTSGQSYGALRRIATGSVPTTRGRVLVVDDEPSILRAVSRTLGRSHDVVTATDGDEALEILRGGAAFDAVMTDVQMPRLNGMELYRTIEREFPKLADRVLFMTGGVFGGEVESFLRGLKQRVLRKPFDPDLLRRAVDERVAISRVA